MNQYCDVSGYHLFNLISVFLATEAISFFLQRKNGKFLTVEVPICESHIGLVTKVKE